MRQRMNRRFAVIGRTLWNWSALLCFALPPAFAQSPEAEDFVPTHPRIGLESQYAEAVIAFNSRNFTESLRILQEVIQKDPQYLQALELQALNLKVTGKLKESLKTYNQLLKIKPKDEHGPLHFEIGTTLFQQKRYKDAKKYLQSALRKNFNPIPSRFFIGLIELAQKNPSRAEREFRILTQSGASEYAVAAHYYLATALFQQGATSEGTAELSLAKTEAAQFEENPLAREVRQMAEQALLPLDRSRWFGNVTTLGMYDTNVALLPEAITSTDSTGNASAKWILSGGAGMMTSPISSFQWVPNWRFSTNQNFNSAAVESEFVTQQLSLFLTYHPLHPFHWGARVEGSATFQNRISDSESGSTRYQPFSTTGDFGLFVKYIPHSKLKTQWDLYYKLLSFATDLDTGTAQRSGYNWGTRFFVRADSGSRWLQPDLTLTYERLQPNGLDYQGHQLQSDLSNSIRVGQRQLLQTTLQLVQLDYSATSPVQRKDWSWTLKASYLIPASSSFTVVFDFAQTQNLSSVPEAFNYSKQTAGVGLTLSLP